MRPGGCEGRREEVGWGGCERKASFVGSAHGPTKEYDKGHEDAEQDAHVVGALLIVVLHCRDKKEIQQRRRRA